MSIHEETAAAIDAKVPGHAQMTRGGDGHDIVSWHGHGFTETMYSGWDTGDARCAFIDAWAKGVARVTAGTFSDYQILHRAEQWEYGNGPHIDRGHKNPAFAEQVRQLVAPQGNRSLMSWSSGQNRSLLDIPGPGVCNEQP
jgi:hypothetical protein